MGHIAIFDFEIGSTSGDAILNALTDSHQGGNLVSCHALHLINTPLKRRPSMKRILPLLSFVFLLFLACPVSEGADLSMHPSVIATNPKNGASNADPSLTKITVTFNKQMTDKSWSWSYENKDSFPQTTGQPYYIDHYKTCLLPAKLEPGKKYVIWINTAKFKNFKDRSGNAAEPYKLVFSTRQK